MNRLRSLIYIVPVLALLAPAGEALAQNRAPNANWKLANRYSNDFLRQFVFSSSLTPNWINKTDTFWYSWRDSNGIRFMIVDPKKRTKKQLFDSAEMAAKLSEALKRPYDTTNLPITTVTFDEKQNHLISFTVERRRFQYDLNTKELKQLGPATGSQATQAPPQGQGGGGRFGQGG
ncbi:MAG TPA: hypothetical protein VM328_00800, partial [Fimbriimonadaceae bacterium]|nr:hypothetical protein [Fimbriimonadaceae bacterium]